MRKTDEKKGETLVEMMVSIVVFLLLVAVLQGSVAFCTSAQDKSRQIREDANRAVEAFYKERNTGTPSVQPKEELSFLTAEGYDAFTVDTVPEEWTVTYDDTEGEQQQASFHTYGKAGDP